MILDNVIKQAADCARDNKEVLTGRTTVLGHTVRYEMRRARTMETEWYSFEVIYRGEHAICIAACSYGRAREIFLALLQGRVTPCSFAYIMQELTEPGALIDCIPPKNKILC